MPSPEVLVVLADEIADAEGALAQALADYGAAADGQQGAEAIARYREPLARLSATAEVLGLSGLQELCARIDANVAGLEGRDLTAATRDLFEKWPGLVIGYLRAPKDGVYSRELADHLRQRDWPLPLDPETAAELGRRLSVISESIEEADDRPTRATQARSEDVALAVGDGVNPALVESFLAEAPLQAGAYTSLIENIIRGGAGPDTLNEARRLVHSIKGAANTIGVRGISQLTHHLEDLLEYLAQRSITPQGRIAKLLMDAADCLEMMLESLIDNAAAPGQAQAVLQRLLDAANAIDRGEAVETLAGNAPVPVDPAPATDAPAASTGKAPNDVTQTAASPLAPEIKRAIRVAATTIDEILRLSGEMTIGRAHIQERLHRATALTAELREHQSLLQTRAADLERLVTVQGIAAGQKHGAAASGGIFDALEMDQYSELHGTVHGIVETVSDVQALSTRVVDALSAIDTAVTQQGLVNGELHEQVMRARMVPAAAIEPRLSRTVRQVCDVTGKRARFEFHGADVMLDDHVVNDLINPLAHLLRNAVGHGIETPDERTAIGKPPEGSVRLGFTRDGNHIVISCEDDGAGLDLPRIHGIAVQRGLIAESVELGEAEIARLILLPGFSTAGNVSEVSGRGVGMDIVHTSVRKLKGTLDIQSRAGQGCRFLVRLPLTLGSAHCLIVRSGETLAAIPTDILERVVFAGAAHIERLGLNWVFREERESIPVRDLADLLGQASGRAFGQPDDARPVAVVRGVDGRQAVVVDALLTGRDLVIKHLGHYLRGVRGVVGASLLGDGRVLPVLDMHELLQRRREETTVRPQLVRAAAAMRPMLPSVLVVDDSLSVRQALTQLLEDDGFQVHTARDGLEALELVARERPAAMLVDLEMPRMNGLELTQRLRERDETRQLPVIMVTSRTSDKHRAQAQLAGVNHYVTKPYREGDLLARLRSMLSKAA